MEKNFDTIIVPAHKWGFDNVLMEKNIWYIKKINESYIKKFKYIAFYQTSPVCAINYYAKIKKITYNWELSHYDIFLKGKLIKIKEIVLDKDKRYLAPQNAKYYQLNKLLRARRMSDVYGKK